jgi:hypothetical protein
MHKFQSGLIRKSARASSESQLELRPNNVLELRPNNVLELRPRSSRLHFVAPLHKQRNMSVWEHFFGITATFNDAVAQGILASLPVDLTRDAKLAHLSEAGGVVAAADGLLSRVICTYCFSSRNAHSLYMKEHLCFCPSSPHQLKLEVASTIHNMKSLKSGADRRHALAQMAEEFSSSKLPDL